MITITYKPAKWIELWYKEKLVIEYPFKNKRTDREDLKFAMMTASLARLKVDLIKIDGKIFKVKIGN